MSNEFYDEAFPDQADAKAQRSAPKPTPAPLNCRECGHDWLTPCDDRRCGKPHCFCRSCVIEPTPEPTPALEPHCDWFSAKKAIEVGISACFTVAGQCEKAARDMSDEGLATSAESYRTMASVMQAFIRQYSAASVSSDSTPASSEIVWGCAECWWTGIGDSGTANGIKHTTLTGHHVGHYGDMLKLREKKGLAALPSSPSAANKE